MSARSLAAVLVALALGQGAARAQGAQGAPPAGQPARIFLAVGAHAGDMELTAGMLLAKQRRLGDRVVLLHLTLGEGGNPRLSPEAYGAQKRREAEEAAAALGAEVLFGPWKDGELPTTDEAKRWVADAIRRVRPTHVVTHWRESIHKDHAAAHRLVADAVLLASLAGVRTEHPPHRGVRAVWYAENWEDAAGFAPYVYVDVTEGADAWQAAVTKYEFVRGGISSFRYLDYYTALATMRGAEARKGKAEAFDVDAAGKRRVLAAVP